MLIALTALGVLAWQWLETRATIGTTQEELARRLAEADTTVQEARVVSKQNKESLDNLTAKLGALESRIAESQSHQIALETLYEELGRTKDDRVITDVEGLLTAASQQLQFAGNVGGALVALENADQRLASADRPVFFPLRKAISKDIDALKALPNADITGMSLQMENVIAAADKLPLDMEQRPGAPAASDAKAGEESLWERLAKDFWRDVRQLVRVSRVDKPDPGLLAPEHAFFLRENLKLRLLSARIALLQRDERVFHEEVRQCLAWITRFFDARSKAVQEAQGKLERLAEARLNVDMPSLTETFNALSALKQRQEKAALNEAKTTKARGN